MFITQKTNRLRRFFLCFTSDSKKVNCRQLILYNSTGKGEYKKH